MAAPTSTEPPRMVFVLGAGASAELGLPVGAELKTKIAGLLDIKFARLQNLVSGDELIFEALSIAARELSVGEGDVNALLHVARRIASAMPQAISIDNFIDAHRGNRALELCGKLAIIRSILHAEQRSQLHFNRLQTSAPDPKKLPSSWHNSLFQLLTENCTLDQLEARLSTVAFLVFNYDRCLEQHLFYSLQNYYGITADAAAIYVRRLRIFHPYGTVGALPWMSEAGGIEYGLAPQGVQLFQLVDMVKTFTEGTDPSSSAVVQIRQLVATAKKVVFLGFAFHPLNLDLLSPGTASGAPTSNRLVFATAHGMSQSDAAVVSSELCTRLGLATTGVHLRTDKTCTALFSEYWRTLYLA